MDTVYQVGSNGRLEDGRERDGSAIWRGRARGVDVDLRTGSLQKKRLARIKNNLMKKGFINTSVVKTPNPGQEKGVSNFDRLKDQKLGRRRDIP